MTDNPLDTDKDRQRRISERAYHLWQSEGELHGHDREYWERAEELIGMEDSADSGQLPNPMSVPGNDPSRPPMVEEASIQENLGEFPGQTDQGDRLHAPSAEATHDHVDIMPETKKDRTRKEASAAMGRAATAKPTPERKAKQDMTEEKPVMGAAKGRTATSAAKGNKGR